MKKILITGAGSYIGTSVEKWLEQWPDKYKMTTLDMVPDSWKDFDFTGFDVVYHVAGIAHKKNVSGKLYEEVNHILAAAVAEKAFRANVKQLILMSSGAVYTQSDRKHREIIVNETTGLQPSTEYGISKLRAETHILKLAKNLGGRTKISILRPPTVYGPGAKGNYNHLAKLASVTSVFPKIGNERSMIYIDNLCEFIRLVIDSESDGIFLPQNREYVNTSEMVREIAACHNKKVITTPLFNWVIFAAGSHFNTVNKVFGTYCYEKICYFNEEYQIVDFKSSIKECEKTAGIKNDENTEEPIRVLNVVGLMSPGGIETLIMNIYRNMDRSKVQFDFLTHKGMDGVFDDEIRSLGGRVFKMPKLRDGEKTYYWKIFIYIKDLMEFFREHPEYHVIHGHMTNTAVIYMPIAKRFGQVSCCISHSHLTQARPGLSGILTNLLHKPLPRIATDYFACSEKAANWIYPKSFIKSNRIKIIKNGIDPKNFCFDAERAGIIRKELKLQDNLVIGNVARFKTEKNHTFQIDIFREIHNRIPNAVLLLIGDGELRPEIERKVYDSGLKDSVQFLGVRSDIPDLMLAMDVFLLPSLYEGLPVVAIEAQASGLPVITSTEVTKETDITGNVTFLDLKLSAEEWAEKVIGVADTFERKDMYDYIQKNGYDITKTAAWLQNFYIRKHNEHL